MKYSNHYFIFNNIAIYDRIASLYTLFN